VNTALRALHDVLASPRPAARWLEVLARGVEVAAGAAMDDAKLEEWMRRAGLREPVGQWRACLTLLGVLTEDRRLDEAAARDVATALQLVGDSFEPRPFPGRWTLVATVPPDVAVRPAMRRTAGLIVEQIERARRSLLLAAPFVDASALQFLGPPLLTAAGRGVQVRMLTSADFAPVVRELGDRWPTNCAGGPLIVATAPTTTLSTLGSHAKVVVVDDERAYVGSANLTAAGLGRHVELGVEIEGTQVQELSRLLLGLSRLGRIYRYPPAPPTRAVPPR
jgi:phosphatidylserine/phosphatidylglycerophosphate/cardiolipin synthase-like enzyme